MNDDSMWADAPTFGAQDGVHYIRRPGSYAIAFDAQGRVAVCRSITGLHLPGGGAEAGESPVQTLEREVREECGCTVDIQRMIGRAIEHLDAGDEGCFRKECTFFLATFGAPSATGEDELLWVDPDDAIPVLRFGSQRWAVQEALEVRGR